MPISKRSIAALAFTLPVMAVTACSGGGGDAAEPTTQVAAGEEASSAVANDAAIPGEVGKKHGHECGDSVEDCNVNFTIEKFEVLEECPGDSDWQPVQGEKILAVQALIEVAPQIPQGSDASSFGNFSEWSALTEDGVNVPVEEDIECQLENVDSGMGWNTKIHPGDNQRTYQYLSIPEDSVEMRLTHFFTESRWKFDLA